ncbi:MAG: hypothetical protein ACLUFV_09725 [Acutalibacteraceae bacterium]
MDGDFLGKVKALLSDPESLERITAIAKGMSFPAGCATQTSAPEQPAVPTAAASRLRPSRRCPRLRPQSRDSRLTLLEPSAAAARGEAREDRLFAAGDDHGERTQGPAVKWPRRRRTTARTAARFCRPGPAKAGPGAPALHQNERRQLSPRESNRTVMYNTKLSGGSADREQLLRIQRELNEKYENEQPQASAAYAQEAAVAVADEPAQEAAACAPRRPARRRAPGTPGNR